MTDLKKPVFTQAFLLCFLPSTPSLGFDMKRLQEKILAEGQLLPGNVLKVDHFLNHQIDVALLDAIGLEFSQRFANTSIDRILTIEASGIAVAVMAARHFNNIPVVFAKKSESLVQDPNSYRTEVHSYTKQKTYQVRVAQQYLPPDENVLIIDDFLANGHAACGLINLVRQAGTHPAGVGIVIEKGFQNGGRLIAEQGVRLESLAVLASISESGLTFRE